MNRSSSLALSLGLLVGSAVALQGCAASPAEENSAATSDALGFQVLYDCNQNAAVVDYEFVDMGMRGGTYHSYQFVIRDQGVIDYLARTGGVAPRAIISGGHEALVTFEVWNLQAPFSKTGSMERTVRGGFDDDGWVYSLAKEGGGIRFTGRSPRGNEGSWFFDSCAQRFSEST